MRSQSHQQMHLLYITAHIYQTAEFCGYVIWEVCVLQGQAKCSVSYESE